MIPGNKDTRDGIVFSIPFLIVYLAFMIYPLLSGGLYISFFKWDILSTAKFIGWENYATLFSDAKFYSSLWHTLQFVLITTPSLLVLGFLMALAVTGSSPYKHNGECILFPIYLLHDRGKHALGLADAEGLGGSIQPSADEPWPRANKLAYQ